MHLAFVLGKNTFTSYSGRVLAHVASDIIISNRALCKICLRKGSKGVGHDVGGLDAGYDVLRVHREFVLTCSRWQFSSNRLDYAPHLSVFVLPAGSRKSRFAQHRYYIRVCLI